MGKVKLDSDKYALLARQASAEGCVLLRNEGRALPVKKGDTVSVFGRIQFNYYKSGTGSGGLVNTEYVVGILDALKMCDQITLNRELIGIYEAWIQDNPFDNGKGWAMEPWCQKEMPVSRELALKASEKSDIAIIVLGRTAGEDRDNSATAGSYLLTDTEENMIAAVCSAFKRVAVVLNVGNIIDMKWVDTYKPQAVIYAWQGGMEGGNGVVDVLTGKVNPCGRLSDTIAYDITDYPSMEGFGDADTLFYKEDIYVGYRYFETAAKDRVMYPFGYGLSYTEFDINVNAFDAEQDMVTLQIDVKNAGEIAGKEVVQVYVSAPVGKLGKPARTLEAFAKTGLLDPGESQILTCAFPKKQLASYDDGGVTGNRSCFVLEAGKYDIFAGGNVRSAQYAGSFTIETLQVTERLSEACAPVRPFMRFKAKADGTMIEEPVPVRTVDLYKRIADNQPEEIPCTGDKGIKLRDVYEKRASLDEFLGQLANEDLACLMRGEGMCSPRVTPGTASAFGGVSDRLCAFGIPAGCCADGPSGIRMDCGSHAFSLPNGTALACSFNTELIGCLFDMVGQELNYNNVDTLLGPGINIHRTPLNGRNFEYFSEDPLLTGKMAAEQVRALAKYKVTGTIKHYACNNQEFHRNDVDSAVSERALREIYLKGFEIAVKEGGAYSVMSTYGSLNGLWTAGNYDLNTTVLRGEWGFEGIVMTDWWAKINEEGEIGTKENTIPMVRAQNDLYMVCSSPAENSNNDNTMEGLASGRITRGELQRNAANICKVLMRSAVMERYLNSENKKKEEMSFEDAVENVFAYYDMSKTQDIDLSLMDTAKGKSSLIGLRTNDRGEYKLTFEMKAEGGDLAQVPISVFLNNVFLSTITVNGTGNWQTAELACGIVKRNNYIKFYFGQSGMKLGKMTFILVKGL